MTDTVSHRVRFEDFELDLGTAELWRAGVPVDLPPQPSRVLALLVADAAALVPREVLRRQIWGANSVEWETGLHQAISRIRTTLGDSAANPRFIETVPRRGYRFVGRVRSGEGDPRPPLAVSPPAKARQAGWLPKRIGAAVVVGAALVTGVAVVTTWARSNQAGFRTDREVMALSSRGTQGAEAIRLYEEALHLSGQQQFVAAIERFEAAAALAPDWAEPWSALAEAELARPAVGRVDRARLALEAALARNASNARAWRQLAQLRLWEEWDWLGGEQALARAAGLEPKNANLWQLRAAVETVHGRLDDAVAAARRAIMLDPVSTGLRVDLGWTLYYAGDTHGATTECRRSLELDPANPSAFQCLVQTLLVEGRKEELTDLIAERSTALAAAPSEDAAVENYFRRHLAYLDAEPGCGATSAATALAKLALGDTDGALDALVQGAHDGRGWAVPFALVDPLFQAHREDGRFIEAARVLGL